MIEIWEYNLKEGTIEAHPYRRGNGMTGIELCEELNEGIRCIYYWPVRVFEAVK